MPLARKRARAAPRKRSRSPPVQRGADTSTAAAGARGEEAPCVWRTARTRMGAFALCATPAGVSRLKFVPDEKLPARDDAAAAAHADTPPPPQAPPPPSPLAAQAEAWLAQVVAFLNDDDDGAAAQPDFPLDLSCGTPFQRRVWALLREVPFGDTTTYGELARRLGSSPRAVGQAVGANPVGVVVPCHRVVAAAGKLGGFAWGSDLKRALLRREGVPLPEPA
jgi:O-6-methylguanine DNA methyltransferase